MVYNDIEEFRKHISEYGKGSLSKNRRYHVSVRNCSFSGIHCFYLVEYNNEILWLMDSRDSIIAEIAYDDINEITMCKDNFWDVLYTIYSREID